MCCFGDAGMFLGFGMVVGNFRGWVENGVKWSGGFSGCEGEWATD